MHERLRICEPDMNLERAFERGTQRTYTLEWAGVEDFVVGNGPGRPSGNMAREVLFRAGWQLRVAETVPPTHGGAVQSEGASMTSSGTD